MTNITLSIKDTVYRKMHQYSEIKWSEYVRKMILRKVNELELLRKKPSQESIFTMLASEDVLKREWDNNADERWNEI